LFDALHRRNAKRRVGIDDLIRIDDDLSRLRVHDLLADRPPREDDRIVRRHTCHLAIRSLDKAVLVHFGIGGQAANQANVRAFGRLDGANAAVVRVMHVAHVKAGALATQPAGAQRRKGALVRQFVQRVHLLHELGQLAATKELAHHGHHRADVDQRYRRDLLRIADAHALAHDALHAQKPDAQLVLQQLPHGLDAAIAQMVDVIRIFHAVIHADDMLDDVHDVPLRKRAPLDLRLAANAPVQLVPPDPAQVVATRAEKELFQVRAGVVQRRRIAGAHLPVKVLESLLGGLVRVVFERRADVLMIG